MFQLKSFLSGSAGILCALAIVATAQADVRVRSVENLTHERDLTVAELHGTDLWIGTNGGGVLRFDTTSGAIAEKFTRVADGLPDNFINSLAVEADGTVWVGTPSRGLGVFDPATGMWSVIDPSNSPLTSAFITAIEIASDGTVWVGTFDGGLNGFDGTSWTNFTPANSGLSDQLVTSLAEDLNGDLWIGVFGDALNVFDGTTFTQILPADTGTPPFICRGDLSNPPDSLGLISRFVNVLGVDPFTGDVWFRNEDDSFCLLNGTTQFDGTDWRTFTRQNSGIGTNSTETVEFLPNGSVWFGAPGVTAVLANGRFNTFPFTVNDFEAQQDDLWVATPGGLGRINADGSTDEFLEPGLAASLVYDVDRRANAVWFATRSGLSSLIDGVWTEYNTSNSDIPANNVRAVAIDRTGDVWIGTTIGGVARFDGETFEVFDSRNSGLRANRVESLAIDRRGNVWAGHGLLQGLSRYDAKRGVWTDLGVATNVNDIAIQGHDTAWLATTAGPIRVRGNQIESFVDTESAGGLAPISLRSVAVGSGVNGNDVWFGSVNDGVLHHDGENFELLDPDPTLNLILEAIGVDKSGRIFAGSRDFGLRIFDGGTWSTLDFEDGLVSNRVQAITFDTSGRAWVGTEFGVSHLSVVQGRRVKKPIADEPVLNPAPNESNLR